MTTVAQVIENMVRGLPDHSLRPGLAHAREHNLVFVAWALTQEIERRAKLPVIADPTLAQIPLVALGWWAEYFHARQTAAYWFDDLYPAARTYDMLVVEAIDREVGGPPDDESTLLGYYEGRMP